MNNDPFEALALSILKEADDIIRRFDYNTRNWKTIKKPTSSGAVSKYSDDEERKDKANKVKPIINVTSDDGEHYTIYPNDRKKDVFDYMPHQGSSTGQRGMNKLNRLALGAGRTPQDDKDLATQEVENSHILFYSDYINNPELQLELGNKIQKFYADKGIPEEEQGLPPFVMSTLKRYTKHMQALQNDPEYRRNLSVLKGKERDDYQKDYLKKSTGEYRSTGRKPTYSMGVDGELYQDPTYDSVSASMPRADQIGPNAEKRIMLNNFKQKLRSLNNQERDLFNRIQRIITGPFITTQPPRDLNLLINNYQNLAKGKDPNEIRDMWRKLQLSRYESI